MKTRLEKLEIVRKIFREYYNQPSTRILINEMKDSEIVNELSGLKRCEGLMRLDDIRERIVASLDVRVPDWRTLA